MSNHDVEKSTRFEQFVPLIASLLCFPAGFCFSVKYRWIAKSLAFLMCGVLAIIFVEFIRYDLGFYKSILYLNAITSAFVVGFMGDVFGSGLQKFSGNGVLPRKILMFFLRFFVVVLVTIPISIFPLAMFFSGDGWKGVNLGSRIISVGLTDAWVITIASTLFYAMLIYVYFRSPLIRDNLELNQPN